MPQGCALQWYQKIPHPQDLEVHIPLDVSNEYTIYSLRLTKPATHLQAQAQLQGLQGTYPGKHHSGGVPGMLAALPQASGVQRTPKGSSH